MQMVWQLHASVYLRAAFNKKILQLDVHMCKLDLLSYLFLCVAHTNVLGNTNITLTCIELLLYNGRYSFIKNE